MSSSLHCPREVSVLLGVATAALEATGAPSLVAGGHGGWRRTLTGQSTGLSNTVRTLGDRHEWDWKSGGRGETGIQSGTVCFCFLFLPFGNKEAWYLCCKISGLQYWRNQVCWCSELSQPGSLPAASRASPWGCGLALPLPRGCCQCLTICGGE